MLYAATVLVSCAILIVLVYYMGMQESPTEGVTINFTSLPLKRLEVRFFGWTASSETSIDSFVRNADHFTWVSPAQLQIDIGGNLIGRIDERIVESARKNNVGILPLVANADFDRDLMHKILTDDGTRKGTIDSIVAFVIEQDFSGVNIDWENIPPEDRRPLDLYMKELAERLHAYGKLVTIDVSGKTSDETTGWGGAWDYQSLGQICDYVCIMVYDYHWSGGPPGPIGPLSWLKGVIQYALLSIPKERIVIGIPFYGYDWTGNKGNGVTFTEAVDLAITAHARLIFSERDGEYTYSYESTDGKHEVWFQGALSTQMRISASIDLGIDRIAAWSVGQEDPRTWEVINRKA